MRKTRYAELGYDNYGPGHWQVVDVGTGSQIGPIYATKAELLADLPAYASEYGCEGAPEGAARMPRSRTVSAERTEG